MARTRTIKPDFFDNEELAECSPHARLLFIRLWQVADRRGILKDNPRRIAADAFPYEHVDADMLLEELSQRRFITRYEVEGQRCIVVEQFDRHQNPHPKETVSDLPCRVDTGPSREKVRQSPPGSNPVSNPVSSAVSRDQTNDDVFIAVCELVEGMTGSPIFDSVRPDCRYLAATHGVERVKAGIGVAEAKGCPNVGSLRKICDRLTPSELKGPRLDPSDPLSPERRERKRHDDAITTKRDAELAAMFPDGVGL